MWWAIFRWRRGKASPLHALSSILIDRHRLERSPALDQMVRQSLLLPRRCDCCRSSPASLSRKSGLITTAASAATTTKALTTARSSSHCHHEAGGRKSARHSWSPLQMFLVGWSAQTDLDLLYLSFFFSPLRNLSHFINIYCAGHQPVLGTDNQAPFLSLHDAIKFRTAL